MHIILAGDWKEAHDFAERRGWLQSNCWRFAEELSSVEHYISRGEAEDVIDLPGALSAPRHERKKIVDRLEKK